MTAPAVAPPLTLHPRLDPSNPKAYNTPCVILDQGYGKEIVDAIGQRSKGGVSGAGGGPLWSFGPRAQQSSTDT